MGFTLFFFFFLQSTRENQIICILDLLPSRGLFQIRNFINYLGVWYSWIVQHYKEVKTDDNAEKDMNPILAEAEVPPLPLWHVSRKDEVGVRRYL